MPALGLHPPTATNDHLPPPFHHSNSSPPTSTFTKQSRQLSNGTHQNGSSNNDSSRHQTNGNCHQYNNNNGGHHTNGRSLLTEDIDAVPSQAGSLNGNISNDNYNNFSTNMNGYSNGNDTFNMNGNSAPSIVNGRQRLPNTKTVNGEATTTNGEELRLAPHSPYMFQSCRNGVVSSSVTTPPRQQTIKPNNSDSNLNSACYSFKTPSYNICKRPTNDKESVSASSNTDPSTGSRADNTNPRLDNSSNVPISCGRANTNNDQANTDNSDQDNANVIDQANTNVIDQANTNVIDQPNTNVIDQANTIIIDQRFMDLTSSLTPTSYSGVSESAGAWGTLGHYNILHVTTRDPGQHWFTRYCCYTAHCYRLKVAFPYPTIHNETILADDRLKTALELAVGEVTAEQQAAGDGVDSHHKLMGRQLARANKLLDDMKAAISSTLIRLTGYVLFKVFSNLLKSVVVHKGQLEAIQRASKKGTPLIFVPLHRSHVDYLFVTWVLFNCQIPAPIVAAGDNLNMPVFGALLRGTGGFFIKRRLESTKARKDLLYRAVLQCYMTQSLLAGYNLEFFIEGGRTRTGKPAMPKGGLMSVILDAHINGMLGDAMIVPVAINYDKLVDGNFITEQLGQSKVPESFWGAVCAICKVLSTNYGQSRIDFGAPFSLQEFVHRNRATPQTIAPTLDTDSGVNRGHQRSLSTPVNASNQHLAVSRMTSEADTQTNLPGMLPAMSNSSLFGSEVTDEYRDLVNKLGRHIVFDAERCQAMMSSNLLAWLLSFVHRDGASLDTLSADVTELTSVLHQRGRDVGFTGDSNNVVAHAVKLLGPGLIKSEVSGDTIVYRAVTMLPNIIELNYYANALLPVFALDAIVAISILSLLHIDLNSYMDTGYELSLQLDKIMVLSTRLCQLLLHEFVLVAPCEELSAKLLDVVDRLQVSGLLTENKPMSRALRGYNDNEFGWENTEADYDCGLTTYTTAYNVLPTQHNLKYFYAYSAMLSPIIDAYCTTVEALQQLVGVQMPEKEFIMATQQLVTDKLEQGTLKFGETIAADPIKNCLKMLEGERVLETHQQETVKCIGLTQLYDKKEALISLLDAFNALRP